MLVYIALVNPQNTPPFFRSAAFKVCIFAAVCIVISFDTQIGFAFGLAMVLSVGYSHMRETKENEEDGV